MEARKGCSGEIVSRHVTSVIPLFCPKNASGTSDHIRSENGTGNDSATSTGTSDYDTTSSTPQSATPVPVNRPSLSRSTRRAAAKSRKKTARLIAQNVI